MAISERSAHPPNLRSTGGRSWHPARILTRRSKAWMEETCTTVDDVCISVKILMERHRNIETWTSINDNKCNSRTLLNLNHIESIWMRQFRTIFFKPEWGQPVVCIICVRLISWLRISSVGSVFWLRFKRLLVPLPHPTQGTHGFLQLTMES